MGIGLVSFTKGLAAKQTGLWLLTSCVGTPGTSVYELAVLGWLNTVHISV